VAQRPTDYISVTICITIRIRESVLDHDPDPARTATLSTHTEQMPSWILAQGPSDYILLMIRITVRIQESGEVRNPDSLDSGIQRRSALSEQPLVIILILIIFISTSSSRLNKSRTLRSRVTESVPTA